MQLLVGAMIVVLALLIPAHLFPPIGALGVILWHLFRYGGVVRCCKFRAPLPTLLMILPLAKFLMSNRNQSFALARSIPKLREVFTDFNSGNATLVNALVIVSSCVPGGRFNQSLIAASLENKQRFCAASSRERQLGVRCVLFDAASQGEHHPKWEKYIHLRQEMAFSREAWFMWIDCDAVFTNASFAWDELLLLGQMDAAVEMSRGLARDMVLARDRNGFNMGVFFMRNTPWSLGFLDAMLALQAGIDQEPTKRERLRDQRALDELLRADSSIIRRIRAVPQQLINSFFSHSEGNGVAWEDGDWIAHQVDCQRPECNADLESLAVKLH